MRVVRLLPPSCLLALGVAVGCRAGFNEVDALAGAGGKSNVSADAAGSSSLGGGSAVGGHGASAGKATRSTGGSNAGAESTGGSTANTGGSTSVGGTSSSSGGTNDGGTATDGGVANEGGAANAGNDAGAPDAGGAPGSGGVSGSAGSSGGITGLAGASGSANLGGSAGAGGSTGAGGSGASGATGAGGSAGTGGSAGGSGGSSGSSGGRGGSAGVANGGAAGGPSLPGCQTASFNAKAYVLCPATLNWNAAKSSCSSVGMDLVRVNDATENQWLYTSARSLSPPVDQLWIGGSQTLLAGTWAWTDGTLFWLGGLLGLPQNGLYTNWALAQPAGLLDNCAALGVSAGNGAWYSDGCTLESHAYACEAP